MPVNVGNQPHRDNGEVVVRIAPNHCFTHSNRKRAEVQGAPVVPVLPENESTVIHANNLEVEQHSVLRTKAVNG